MASLSQTRINERLDSPSISLTTQIRLCLSENNEQTVYDIPTLAPSVPVGQKTSTITLGSVLAVIVYVKNPEVQEPLLMFPLSPWIAGTASSTPGLSISLQSSPPMRTAVETTSRASAGQPATMHTTPTSSKQSLSTSTTKSRDDKGISSGAAAAIGIGAALGGLLLASLLFFFYRRNSKEREPLYIPEVPLKQLRSYGENKQAILPQVTTIDMRSFSFEQYLPQPVADDIISSDMSKLKSMINNHVVSYYRTWEVERSAIDETTLAVLMEPVQISVRDTTSAMINPQTRIPALRCFVGSAIFSRIGPASRPSSSFLPPAVAGCLEAMTGDQHNDYARTVLLSKWRPITASMIQPLYGEREITDSDSRIDNISNTLDQLDVVLTRLRARRDENAGRLQNLEEILKRAAEFGLLLFSHPSVWMFDWQARPCYGPEYEVIFPALLQLTDENGERLSHPRGFGEAELARLIA